MSIGHFNSVFATSLWCLLKYYSVRVLRSVGQALECSSLTQPRKNGILNIASCANAFVISVNLFAFRRVLVHDHEQTGLLADLMPVY
jgi:hypothetical protein